jgi:glycosyltransferase involved in cell wall biosynthesis
MITIGISIFNAEPTLLDAIRSVFAQTVKDWELILIDDGSTDGSLALARSIKDPRVRVVSDGVNKGLPARLNQIVDEAKFDLIMRMDADDLMHPQRLEKQLQVLQKNPEIDLVCSGLYSVDNKLVLKGARHSIVPLCLTLGDVVHGRCQIVHASILVRKSWYLRNRYNPKSKRIEDYELFVGAISRADLRIVAINEYLYIYREEGSVNFNKLRQVYLNKLKFVVFNAPLNIPIFVRITFGVIQLIKLMVSFFLNLFRLNRVMLLVRGNAEVSSILQHDFDLMLDDIKKVEV